MFIQNKNELFIPVYSCDDSKDASHAAVEENQSIRVDEKDKLISSNRLR